MSKVTLKIQDISSLATRPDTGTERKTNAIRRRGEQVT